MANSAMKRTFATFAILVSSLSFSSFHVSGFFTSTLHHQSDRLNQRALTHRSFHRTSSRSVNSRLEKRIISTETRLFQATSGNDDKEEWRALLATFQLYKAAYGDLKIPIRFVVPSMKPWPGKYNGLFYCSFPLHFSQLSHFSFRGNVGHETWAEGGPNSINRKIHR